MSVPCAAVASAGLQGLADVGSGGDCHKGVGTSAEGVSVETLESSGWIVLGLAAVVLLMLMVWSPQFPNHHLCLSNSPSTYYSRSSSDETGKTMP